MNATTINEQSHNIGHLIGEIVDCLYSHDFEGSRKYVKFCERYVHRQCIYRPILEIEEDHLSLNLKRKLIALRKENPEAFEQAVTDAVICLYEKCNNTRFNRRVERQYAKWRIV